MIMNRSKYLRAILSTGLLGALLISGCTNDFIEPSAPSSGEPKESAEVSQTPKSTPESSAAPTKPPEMKHRDLQAAIATAQYFLDVYAHATTTGDTTDFKNLFAPSCTFCNDALANIGSRSEQGNRIVDGDMVRSEGTVNPGSESTEDVSIYFDLTQQPAEVWDEDDNLVTTFAAGTFLVKVEVQLSNGAWTVKEVFGEEQ